jgi:DNA repair protein RecO (recombination protein O)
LLAKGRGSLDTVIGCQAVDAFLPLKSDLDLCASALYATELVNQFGVERQENRPLFNLLLELMQSLSSLPVNSNNAAEWSANDGLLRYFEVHLLESVGYRPQLQQCVSCRQSLPTSSILYFSVSAGGAVCPACKPKLSFTYSLSLPALAALRMLQDGGWPSAFQVNPEPRLRRELEMLLRNYLRFILERDIRSAAWLDVLRHHNHSPQAAN